MKKELELNQTSSESEADWDEIFMKNENQVIQNQNNGTNIGFHKAHDVNMKMKNES